MITVERILSWRTLPRSERRWVETLIVTFGVVVFLGWRALVPWTESENHRTRALEKLTDRTQVIALGSSHVFASLNPALMKLRFMNLAAAVCDFVCMEGVFLGHFDQLAGLEAVVIEFDSLPLRYNAIVAYAGDYRRLLDLRPSIAGMHVPWGIKYQLAYDRILQNSVATGPLVAREKFTPIVILARIRNHPSRRDETIGPGYWNSHGVMSPEDDGRAKVAQHHRESDATAEEALPMNFEALVRIIRRTRERNVLPLLVRFPHHRTYWEAKPREWEEQAERALRGLIREFGPEGFTYWDLGREPSFRDEQFRNGDHLNDDGATLFSHYFDQRLRALLDGRRRASRTQARVVRGALASQIRDDGGVDP